MQASVPLRVRLPLHRRLPPRIEKIRNRTSLLLALHYSGNMSDSLREATCLTRNDKALLPLQPDMSIEEDWEAIADRAPDVLLSSQSLPEVSKLSLEDTKVTPKRRGRGTFSYKKDELYSDQISDKLIINNHRQEDELVSSHSEGDSTIRNLNYGTQHVLVLADFPPSTMTTELEKLFQDFRDRRVVIRWVNDTVALAVFPTPSIALEARNCIRFTMTVRVLEEKDTLFGSISPKDLEPPRQRPQTSARTAQRLIAHGMGLKLPSAAFGTMDLKKQEDDRKSRIVMRQKLKDDAWGHDDN